MLTIIILLFYIRQNQLIFMRSLSLYPVKKYFVILLDLRKIGMQSRLHGGAVVAVAALLPHSRVLK